MKRTPKILGHHHIRTVIRTCGLFVSLLFILLINVGLTNASVPESVLFDGSKEISVRSFPFFNQKLIRSWWEPLREHIYAKTGVIARISTSADYSDLLSDSAEKQFDLYIVPDHFISLMIREHYAIPVVGLNLQTSPVLIVRNDVDVKEIQDLQSRCIAMVQEIALTSIAAKDWLAEKGLNPMVDYQVMYLDSFEDVIMKLFSRKCDAGIITSGLAKKLPRTINDKFDTIEIPLDGENWGGLSILAKGSTETELLSEIQQALISFGKTEKTYHHLASPIYVEPTLFDSKRLEYLAERYRSIQPLLMRYLSDN
mgnify:CR=1 FL=1